MSKTVIAAASYYNQKYYFSKEFTALAPNIKGEIKKLVITAADKSKGVFSIAIDDCAGICFETGGLEDDMNYDEIEGKLQIKRIEEENAELLNKLAVYNRLKVGVKDEKRG